MTPGAAGLPSVLTAVSARWDGPVVAAVEASRQLTIARRCADLADLLAAAASGLGRVALVSGQLRGLTLSTVATLRDGGVEVVGLADPDDDQGELRLWQLGVRSVVSATAAPHDLVAALLDAAGAGHHAGAGADRSEVGGGWVPESLGEAAGADPILASLAAAAADIDPIPVRDTLGHVVAVWGPTGSPGRTTVAVNLAVELALLGREVLLIDADTYGGCVAQTLALLDEAPGIATAARAAEQGTLDLAALARLALQVRPGLRVLTGISKAERWPEIRGAALERVLQVCRALVDDVVVDVGFCLEDDEELSYDTQAPRRNQATLTTLQLADAAVVVGGCDPVSLQRLVRGLQELGTVRAPELIVVVNRVRSGPVGSQPERLVADALERFAGVSRVHTIPDDPAAFDAAMLAGRALAEIVPAAPARRAFLEVVGEVARRAPVLAPLGAEDSAGASALSGARSAASERALHGSGPDAPGNRGRRHTWRGWGRSGG